VCHEHSSDTCVQLQALADSAPSVAVPDSSKALTPVPAAAAAAAYPGQEPFARSNRVWKIVTFMAIGLTVAVVVLIGVMVVMRFVRDKRSTAATAPHQKTLVRFCSDCFVNSVFPED
jgi:hypothetical protein